MSQLSPPAGGNEAAARRVANQEAECDMLLEGHMEEANLVVGTLRAQAKQTPGKSTIWVPRC